MKTSDVIGNNVNNECADMCIDCAAGLNDGIDNFQGYPEKQVVTGRWGMQTSLHASM